MGVDAFDALVMDNVGGWALSFKVWIRVVNAGNGFYSSSVGYSIEATK